MPRFAANLTMLFGEVPFEDRFAAAARAGFAAVEYLFPYAYAAEDLAGRLAANGLEQVLFNLPAGDWEAGERGIACLPGRTGEFQDGVGRAIDYVKALRCPRLNCLAGVPPEGADPDACARTFEDNLRFAAEGLQLLIEPINTRDIPGFFLHRSAQAMAVIEAVGAPNLGLQYDVYHMQVMEGDLAPTTQRLLPQIGHLQIDDTPGRHEPGTGEINYGFLFAFLDRIGYDGWVGCEYKPATTTEAGLGWFDPYRTRLETRIATADGDAVTLEETILYALSGGQESDRGTIGGRDVIEARKDGTGIVYILGPGPTIAAGDPVTVALDWPRRYRLMRLHFAAELVLELVYRMLGRPEKIGAHIAEDKARIDFALNESVAPHFPALTAEVERIVAADQPIASAWSDETAERRYWQIPGFDPVPCGGTHLKSTGEVGAIQLKRKNIGKGKERIEITLVEP